MRSRKHETFHEARPWVTLAGGFRTWIGTIWLALAAAVIVAPAQTEQTSNRAAEFARLVSFKGTDGGNPTASLVQGADGNLYGTTYSWGQGGYGTVFKVSPTGKLTTIYSFCSRSDCTDGENPVAGLVQASDGNLYGTTEYGGRSGYGTVFRITPGAARVTMTTLYSFCSQGGCADGSNPVGGLIQASDGNLYGTTPGGGTNGNGTIFKITLSGTLTSLHSFAYSTDGARPYGGLIQATDGNLYGTNAIGGPRAGAGTVFQITLSGTLTTLYNFCTQNGCPDGELPESGLIQATDANLYGTTTFGGANKAGTVFRIGLSGTLATLYSFCSQSLCADGKYPFTGVTQASDGNFYGVTGGGGVARTCEPIDRCGTAFKITPSGTLTTLHRFCSQACADGEYPFGGLVQASNGKLYGTAQFGGASDACTYGCGTIFTLSVGVRPLEETQPTAGDMGTPVEILGEGFNRHNKREIRIVGFGQFAKSLTDAVKTNDGELATASGLKMDYVRYENVCKEEKASAPDSPSETWPDVPHSTPASHGRGSERIG